MRIMFIDFLIPVIIGGLLGGMIGHGIFLLLAFIVSKTNKRAP